MPVDQPADVTMVQGQMQDMAVALTKTQQQLHLAAQIPAIAQARKVRPPDIWLPAGDLYWNAP